MKKNKICIVGLGYVGLPLARLFATKYSVVGFDIDLNRISELMSGVDTTLELDNNTLRSVLVEKHSDSTGLFCTNQVDAIKKCNYFIITVPTPVDNNNRPILTPLLNASETVGSVLKKGDTVIYESTVYPGATEEDCVPVLERTSGLKFNQDFHVGYSPERINPGDKEHTVDKILKVTSGSTPIVGKKINQLYSSVIQAGTYLAPSIKVAEASKVIENSQRDINIAFVNELAKIFNILEINTNDVLKASATKWNFLPFKPGLVGGHCIGVDPYYLAQKAQENGYHPEIILAGRRINDGMADYVASQIVKCMIKKNIFVNGSDILILGMTFKENCPDVRNTKVVDLIKALEDYGSNITVYDPWADKNQVKNEYDIELLEKLYSKKYDCLVLAVSHDYFLNIRFDDLKKKSSVLYDIKGVLGKNSDGCL